jgi:hypothetical protein
LKPGWKPKTCGSAAPSQLAPPCAALSAVFSDAEAAKNGDPHQIFTGALWPRPQGAENLLAMWETFAALHDPTGIWTFWRDWYRGMLTGAPMDWDLQQPMALIKDEIWKAGPEDVAKEIERIQAKFVLEREVKRLKEELTALEQATSSPLIGATDGLPAGQGLQEGYSTALGGY